MLLLLALAFGATAPGVDSAPAAGNVDFATQIRPILESRCYECHGETKQKGRLRLDQRGSVFEPPKGKKPRVVAGKPDESTLYTLTVLPKDDADIMPAEGEPLTAEQIALIRTWIEQGAQWPQEEGTPAPEPKTTGAQADATGKGSDDLGLSPISESERLAEDAVMSKIGERGGLALRVAANTSALEVNYALLGGAASDADLALLLGLEKNLVWLNLSRTAISDSGLAVLGSFKELRRLNLSNTKISDAGLGALSGLQNLEYLNLYGTTVTDAGIASLSALPRLRDVFVWQTAVSESGAKALADARPGVTVDRGVYEPAKSEPILEELAPVAAAPINTKCPISGADVDPNMTVTIDEQAIAFCCGNCKAQFEKDPQAFLGKVAEFKPNVVANASPAPVAEELWSGRLVDLDGKEVDLATLRGRVVLVVNTASLGRYAEQFSGLQTLEMTYRDKGFAVVGFPSNDFGAQEPGDARAIAEFARKQYGASFMLFQKDTITGSRSPAAKLFDRLATAAGKAPSWNFTKYLVSKDGKTVSHFAPKVDPTGAELRAAIDASLQ